MRSRSTSNAEPQYPNLRRVVSRALLLTVLLAVGSSALAAEGAGDSIRWLDPDGQPLPFSDDEEVLDFLRTARVVSMERINSGINKPRKVLLERAGLRMHAVFRDVEIARERLRIGKEFHMFFRDNAHSETAAYALARLLGMDHVPPTVRRSIDGHDGSLQAWIERAMSDADRRERRVQPPGAKDWFAQLARVRVFDELVRNIDRHPGNLLIDSDWRLWWIDHTRAFQWNPRIRRPEHVTHVDARLWERLQRVSDDDLRDALRGTVPRREIESLLKRRAHLVERIEALIVERGEGAVILP